MLKLSKLFSLIALLSLLFVSCQSNEDITSPISELNKPGPLNWGTPPSPVNIPLPGPGELTEVDLVAGQTMVVGYITVEKVGSNLEIYYYTTEGDWTIAETHLMVVANPNEFIVNNAGNPQVGLFPYGETGLSGNTAGPYSIPIPSNLTDNMVYIGAHAVVEGDCGVSSASLCGTFPDQAEMWPDWLPNDAPLYTVKSTFDYTSDIFYGFCFDNSRSISDNNQRTVRFICSYDDMPVCTPPAYFIELPENLDLVNWIINNRDASWTRNDIQAAIWQLINPSGTAVDWQNSTPTSGEWPHDPAVREAIVAAAEANGEGFVPDCGDYVIVLVYGPGEICNPIRQVVGLIVPIECGPCDSETAWAFNLPLDGTSNSFPGENWFRYFGYQVD